MSSLIDAVVPGQYLRIRKYESQLVEKGLIDVPAQNRNCGSGLHVDARQLAMCHIATFSTACNYLERRLNNLCYYRLNT